MASDRDTYKYHLVGPDERIKPVELQQPRTPGGRTPPQIRPSNIRK